jgi:formate/nitrite transporter FocA (FNT family)
VTPSVLGNAVGGVLLVALLNHGQVLADRET